MQQKDPYKDVPPPAETDGPQGSVDPSTLEEEAHPVIYKGDEGGSQEQEGD